MIVLICQCCGTVLHEQTARCTACGVDFSLNRPSEMPSTVLPAPMRIENPQLLEKLMTEVRKAEKGSSDDFFVGDLVSEMSIEQSEPDFSREPINYTFGISTKRPENNDDLVLRIPRRALVVTAIVAGLLVTASVIVFALSNLHQDGIPESNSAPAGQADIGGLWRIRYQTGIVDDLEITQHGKSFVGRGVAHYGQGLDLGFAVDQGLISPDGSIAFTKRFAASAWQSGAPKEPIEFRGRLSREANDSGVATTLAGTFKVSLKNAPDGHALMTGSWSAVPARLESEKLTEKQAEPISIQNWVRKNCTDPRGKLDFKRIFMSLAGLVLATCATLVAVSFAVFSPSGLLSRFEKQKYIPSQYRREHRHALAQLGKPLKAGSVPLGTRPEWHFWWPFSPRSLSIPPDLRRDNPHMLILGGSNKGKSRLMASMIAHDIASKDRSVVLLDSDGNLADLIAEYIQNHAPERQSDLIYIDPAGGDGFYFNPLAIPADGDLQALSNAVVQGFKTMYAESPGQKSQWNEQTANILRNAALLLAVNYRTLLDLPALLQDHDFRDLMLEKVELHRDERAEYGSLLENWGQYKKLARTDQWITWVEPILNRISPTLGDGRIRQVFSGKGTSLDLKSVISERKILLVSLSEGELDQNGNLLGSLIVTGLQQAALALSRKKSGGGPVALYLDEFDRFVEKDTVKRLTNETRRYQIGVVGCLRTLQHLSEDFRAQLMVNLGTVAVFALAKKDADLLGGQIFRVDGRKYKHRPLKDFFNPVNASPVFELIMDEEKLNIDRIAGQKDRTYFCYRVGTEAGVFKLRAPDFP
ncbi:MAG: type IV secretory system conjugative DNA transfer family protein [Candidatus Obscuribacterales bacterium]